MKFKSNALGVFGWLIRLDTQRLAGILSPRTICKFIQLFYGKSLWSWESVGLYGQVVCSGLKPLDKSQQGFTYSLISEKSQVNGLFAFSKSASRDFSLHHPCPIDPCICSFPQFLGGKSVFSRVKNTLGQQWLS